MNKKEILEAIKFNLGCLEMGIIDKDDFIQAMEDELNLI